MVTAQNLLKDFETAINDREKALLARRKVVRAFVATDHSSANTTKAQTEISRIEAEVDDILQSLLEQQGTLAGFRAEAEKLCQRCRRLNDYTRDMHQALASDLLLRQQVEHQQKVDVVKNVTFIIAIPAAFVTLRNGLGEDHISPAQAATVGTAAAATVLARKRIVSAFRQIGQTVCRAPQHIKDSFLLYYVREMAKQKMLAIQKGLTATANVMTEAALRNIYSVRHFGREIYGTIKTLAGSTKSKIAILPFRSKAILRKLENKQLER